MDLKYIDIHSHVNFKAFDEDRDAVIRRALDADTWVINVGTQIDTSRKAVEMAHEYEEGVYAIIGLHPIHTGASYHDEKELGEGGVEFTSRGEIFDKEKYLELLRDPKVVAVGECGLDYYRCTPETIQKQKEAFIGQIEIANEVGKPLMLHIRNNPNSVHPGLVATPQEGNNPDAYMDALEILKQYAKVKGDVHFFAGSPDVARDFVEFGFTLSFTGVVTFTHDYDEVIRQTPIEMIMTETDSPYVSPKPYRGRRNEPVYVQEITKKIAEIKGLDPEVVAQTVISNAKRVFKI
ncbi:MAG: TatD family hydrolase [Candidatus Nomurabacteria bacterium]|nr:TatD family hydrolase [Candidatus Nomurabacteria bacterium]